MNVKSVLIGVLVSGFAMSNVSSGEVVVPMKSVKLVSEQVVSKSVDTNDHRWVRIFERSRERRERRRERRERRFERRERRWERGHR